MLPGPAVSCPNCGSASGRFCPACGQDNGRARLEAREVLVDAVRNLVGWESALWRTLRGLVVDPGRLAADYVAGRRRRFVAPARACLLALASWFLLARWLGFDPMELSGFRFGPGAETGEAAQRIERVRELLTGNFDVLLYLSLPLRALVLRALFPRSGRNLAECLVLVLYVAAFGYLAGVAVAPLLAWSDAVSGAARQLVVLAWSVRATRTFFAAGWWASTWRVLAAALVHVLGTAALCAAIVLAYLRFAA
jgi:hypothetical protein